MKLREITGQILRRIHKRAILDGERMVELAPRPAGYVRRIPGIDPATVFIIDGDNTVEVELSRLRFPFNLIDKVSEKA